ncbi:4-hydroxybenzoyl-CoA reductase subunit alpha [uncultured Desulfobacterium sp.]|jgi:4-hydroxybenzoyl-CoA reductase subunit alpha|uniref:4-hydroxybenzoyl-CoA reductase subunit alpha n=1 Tax=uncultured Desulfobacterium sp. TaxID=201089 RepID=A0A445MXR8_9BACT|nr:4-hydroxybenzoyl-CoA reductase subunit alpha [uncultured Desulfobacterium sp.]
MMNAFSVIGKSIPRIDAQIQVTGEAKFTADIILPGMLHGKILHSPYPHAKILNIDTSKAERLSGVYAVATGKDISDIPYACLRVEPAPPFARDRFALCKDKVRFVGDCVAAVAAIDEDIAEEALNLIKVEYEELPAVFDPFEALKPDAPKIHDHGNISVDFSFHDGDVEKGFNESDLIMEEHFETQYVCHSSLETHLAVAEFSPTGELTVWASTQTPFFDQVALAETLDMPVSKVRVIKPYVGGGFGAKAETDPPIICAALLSKKAGRPVKVAYSREEQLVSSTRRHPVFVEQKIGVKKDGTIMAVDSNFVADGGAYNSTGTITTVLHGILQNGPYKVKNLRYKGLRVYTNKPFCGAQRGHGAIQARFVVESMLDMIAEKLGLDAFELRIKNGLNAGDITASNFVITSSGHRESLEKVQKEIGWKDKRGKKDGKGVGLACNFFVSGTMKSFFLKDPPSHSSVKLEARKDGYFTLLSGVSDVGQACNTTLAMIAAEELGVTVDHIGIVTGDTAVTPIDLGSFSSRVTMMGGNAAKMAASEMKRILLEEAAENLEANPEDLDVKQGQIHVKGSPEKSLTYSEVITSYFIKHKKVLFTQGDYTPPETGLEKGNEGGSPAYSFGCHGAEVDVDKETGIVKVKKIVAAHDCGFAINPMAVDGQTEGSVSMTFGQAMIEEFKVDKGQAITSSFLDYKLPTSMDMPEVKSIIVEANDPRGPFGAKEASEGTNIPTIPSITNAIYDAVGVRLKDLPVTPEKILKALEER